MHSLNITLPYSQRESVLSIVVALTLKPKLYSEQFPFAHIRIRPTQEITFLDSVIQFTIYFRMIKKLVESRWNYVCSILPKLSIMFVLYCSLYILIMQNKT